MRYADLPAELRRRGPAPVYWVTGEEDCLRARAVRWIRRAVFGTVPEREADLDAPAAADPDAFNDVVLYGDETDGAEIVSAAREAPMFATRRLVLVKHAEKLPARETEPLLDYLTAPVDSTTVIFASPKLDGRQKFPQMLKEKAAVVDCAPLSEPDVRAWIRAEAGRRTVRLAEDAVEMLADLAGGSLYRLQQELDKLAAFVPPGAVTGPAEVDLLRGGFPGASVFDLTDAIAVMDRGRVLHILARNLEAGEAPLRILGSLVWQYRRLWKAQALLADGRREGELARALGVPSFRVRDLVAQARRFSSDQLQTAFARFLKADSDLKGGAAGTAARVLEALLWALCADLAAPGPRVPAPPVPRPPAPGRKSLSNVRTVRSGKMPGR